MARRRARGDAGTGSAAVAPDDPLADQRARRRHPAERWLSRLSGLLLLVMILQAAFGYALVGHPADGLRTTHFLVGLLVLLLVVGVVAAIRRLPWRGRREQALWGLSTPLLVLVGIQFVTGGMARGMLPGWSADVRMAHIGAGLLVLLLVVIIHVAAIGPSLALAARREHARALEARMRGRS